MNSRHIEPLEQKADVVAGQVRQLRQENDDLRASALWWKHLYESAVKVITDRVGDGPGGCGQDRGRGDAVHGARMDVR
jgi:hypothetical protein